MISKNENTLLAKEEQKKKHKKIEDLPLWVYNMILCVLAGRKCYSFAIFQLIPTLILVFAIPTYYI